MLSRLFLIVALVFAGPLACSADSPAEFEAGKHYQPLAQPVRTRNPDKIEVVEVFWYGCSHCFHFEPMVQVWAKKLPEDVDFWQSPAMWNPIMQVHARVHFTAKALGVLDTVHEPIFEAINNKRQRLADEPEIAKFFANHGVAQDDFKKAFDSFGVASQVRQADARARGYGITGTPELIVNGKYRVTTSMAGGQAQMLKVVDFLVAKERALRAD